MRIHDLFFFFASTSLCLSCALTEGVISQLSSLTGTDADGRCDRRFGQAAEKAPFCQEIRGTVAEGEFRDDCQNHLKGEHAEAQCDHASAIAGCKLNKVNDDGSEVYDWFYDIEPLKKAGANFGEAPVPKTKDDVRALCEDRKRYDDGAVFVER